MSIRRPIIWYHSSIFLNLKVWQMREIGPGRHMRTMASQIQTNEQMEHLDDRLAKRTRSGLLAAALQGTIYAVRKG
jgi:hypothetical protein